MKKEKFQIVLKTLNCVRGWGAGASKKQLEGAGPIEGWTRFGRYCELVCGGAKVINTNGGKCTTRGELREYRLF